MCCSCKQEDLSMLEKFNAHIFVEYGGVIQSVHKIPDGVDEKQFITKEFNIESENELNTHLPTFIIGTVFDSEAVIRALALKEFVEWLEKEAFNNFVFAIEFGFIPRLPNVECSTNRYLTSLVPKHIYSLFIKRSNTYDVLNDLYSHNFIGLLYTLMNCNLGVTNTPFLRLKDDVFSHLMVNRHDDEMVLYLRAKYGKQKFVVPTLHKYIEWYNYEKSSDVCEYEFSNRPPYGLLDIIATLQNQTDFNFVLKHIKPQKEEDDGAIFPSLKALRKELDMYHESHIGLLSKHLTCLSFDGNNQDYIIPFDGNNNTHFHLSYEVGEFGIILSVTCYSLGFAIYNYNRHCSNKSEFFRTLPYTFFKHDWEEFVGETLDDAKNILDKFIEFYKGLSNKFE